jgi:hypothetical protein
MTVHSVLTVDAGQGCAYDPVTAWIGPVAFRHSRHLLLSEGRQRPESRPQGRKEGISDPFSGRPPALPHSLASADQRGEGDPLWYGRHIVHLDTFATAWRLRGTGLCIAVHLVARLVHRFPSRTSYLPEVPTYLAWKYCDKHWDRERHNGQADRSPQRSGRSG